MAAREALLVLGAHRSGTSVVTGLLVRLGAHPPRTLMEGDADNQEGYWESWPIYALHERLLRAAGSRWHAAGQLDRSWCEAQATGALGDECRGLLRSEYGDAPRFVVKDPRICRFVPFWLRILEMEGIAAHAVLVLRDPFEVARSLGVRNAFDLDFSLALWLRHTLAAEFDTRAVPRTMVRYRDVLENWRGVARAIEQDLGLEWPVRASATDSEIERFVNPVLRHHEAGVGHEGVAPTLSDWLGRASSALDRLHARDAAHRMTAQQELDEVRQDLDRATAIIESRLLALHQQVDDLRAERDRVQAERARAETARDHIQAERDRWHEAATRLEQHAQALDVRLKERHRALVEAQQDAAALRASLSWRLTAPLRAMGRIVK